MNEQPKGRTVNVRRNSLFRQLFSAKKFKQLIRTHLDTSCHMLLAYIWPMKFNTFIKELFG